MRLLNHPCLVAHVWAGRPSDGFPVRLFPPDGEGIRRLLPPGTVLREPGQPADAVLINWDACWTPRSRATLELTLEEARLTDTPLVIRASPHGAIKAAEVVGSYSEMAITDFDDSDLPHLLQQARNRPAWRDIDRFVGKQSTLHFGLRNTLRSFVTQRLASPSRAMLNPLAPYGTFVRQVRGLPDLPGKNGSRSLLLAEASSAGLSLGRIVREHTLLRVMSRIGTTERSHLAIQLGFRSRASLDRMLTRHLGMPLREAWDVPLSYWGSRLVEELTPSGSEGRQAAG